MLSAKHGGDVAKKETLGQKMAPFAIAVVAGAVGRYFGFGVWTIILWLTLAWAVAFFGPYQVRRFIRYWRRTHA
jgi:cell division protein FtsW (lipid II flippase)